MGQKISITPFDAYIAKLRAEEKKIVDAREEEIYAPRLREIRSFLKDHDDTPQKKD